MAASTIKGRPCREVELKNGDTLHFLDEWKGREERFFLQASSTYKEDDLRTISDEPERIKLNMGELLFTLLPTLCLQIDSDDKKGRPKTVRPTVDYVDELEYVEDVEVIFNELVKCITLRNKTEEDKKKSETASPKTKPSKSK